MPSNFSYTLKGNLLRIIERRGSKTTYEDYALSWFRTDFGRGFRLDKLSEPGKFYNISIVGGEENTCDCPGFEGHGRCKHVRLLSSLCDNKAI